MECEGRHAAAVAAEKGVGQVAAVEDSAEGEGTWALAGLVLSLSLLMHFGFAVLMFGEWWNRESFGKALKPFAPYPSSHGLTRHFKTFDQYSIC